jgi:DNA processing protein
LDCLYPVENEVLAEEIARSGAVMSEYPLGRVADRQTFPYRNRIVSGLSLGTLVVESEQKGGSMHTADAAMEQGRSVLAVPGRVDLPGARGPHFLLKNGARLVESIEDVLAEFEFEMPDLSAPEAEVSVRPEVVLGVEERRIVEQLWVGPLQVDELGRACAIASPVLSGILLSLEMKRIVRTLPGGVIELATDVRRVNKVESTNE